MLRISPRAVLFQLHKAFDPLNPTISRGMRHRVPVARPAPRARALCPTHFKFPHPDIRPFIVGKFKVPTRLRARPVEPGLRRRKQKHTSCRRTVKWKTLAVTLQNYLRRLAERQDAQLCIMLLYWIPEFAHFNRNNVFAAHLALPETIIQSYVQIHKEASVHDSIRWPSGPGGMAGHDPLTTKNCLQTYTMAMTWWNEVSRRVLGAKECVFYQESNFSNHTTFKVSVTIK